ncbi:MAG: thymidylate synthase [Gammaproteobacteria bacterium]|nr:thymidylate synthase [Gammaproteobacteria bacterium]
MKQYLDTVREALEEGQRKENRTGVDTLSTFNINYEIDLRDGFPLLTTKKISWKNIVIENLWFLSGRTDISLLLKHNCHFWDPWADENGKVPSAYGNFWRHFPLAGDDTNDQIAYVVDQLKTNPMSRRMGVSAWAPGNAQTSALPPCHAFWVLNTQMDKNQSPYLCLHLTQRSCDIALGVPYNIAGYALLLALFSRFSGIPAGVFAHTLIDAHVYTKKEDGTMAEHDHIPNLKEQLTRQPRPLPILEIDPSIQALEDIEPLLALGTDEIMSLFVLHNYDPYPALTFKVAV